MRHGVFWVEIPFYIFHETLPAESITHCWLLERLGASEELQLGHQKVFPFTGGLLFAPKPCHHREQAQGPSAVKLSFFYFTKVTLY